MFPQDIQYCFQPVFLHANEKKARISCASFWHKWTSSQFIKLLRKKLFPVYEYLSTLQDFQEKLASVTGLKMWKKRRWKFEYSLPRLLHKLVNRWLREAIENGCRMSVRSLQCQLEMQDQSVEIQLEHVKANNFKLDVITRFHAVKWSGNMRIQII